MTTFTIQAPRRTVPATARHDCYRSIHKALRLMLTDTLTRVGQTDPFDDTEVAATLAQFDELIELCELHIVDENAFMHPALEKAQPGSAARVTTEHREHEESIADLRDLRGLVADSRDAARSAALLRLYHRLALFAADDFAHMDHEESAHNAVLWAHYRDEELLAIEHELHAAIPPQAMMKALRWMLPALNAPERVELLTGMRAGMPTQVFGAVLEIARERLKEADFAKLIDVLEPRH